MEEEEEHQANQLSSILDLPDPIMVDILLRAELKTIITCKCVCKSWLNLISDSYFADTHFKISDICILAHSYIRDTNPVTKNHPFVLDWEFPNGLKRFECDTFRMVDSCDGLVCMSIPTTQKYCICNPISGEYVMIPPPQDNQLSSQAFQSYFGLSLKTNKYKILRTSVQACGRTRTNKWTVNIFTIGMDKNWRLLQRSMSRYLPWLFLNARSHWDKSFSSTREFIHCFDFDSEDFQKVFLPEFGGDFTKRSRWTTLGLIDNCICACSYFFGKSIQIWVMKERGVRESWTKLLLFSYPHPNGLKFNWLMYNKEYLLFSSNCEFVSYNLKNKQVTKDEQTEKWIHRATQYKPSFILLEEIARGQNWKLVDIRRGIYGHQCPY